jgi:hypothetical protein
VAFGCATRFTGCFKNAAGESSYTSETVTLSSAAPVSGSRTKPTSADGPRANADAGQSMLKSRVVDGIATFMLTASPARSAKFGVSNARPSVSSRASMMRS